MRVDFSENEYCTTSPVFQWDAGQVLEITGIHMAEAPFVYFANKKSADAILVQSLMDEDGTVRVDVPNHLLQEPYNIIAWFSNVGEDSVTTLYRCEIVVRQRPIPEDYSEGKNVPLLREMDRELKDIRMGWDTRNYESAGEAVREQVRELHQSPMFTGNINLGGDNNYSGIDNVGIGNGNSFGGTEMVSIGKDNQSNGFEHLIVGHDNQIGAGGPALALGENNQVYGTNSIAVGKNNIVTAPYSSAEGEGLSVHASNSHAEGLGGSNETYHTVESFKFERGINGGLTYTIEDKQLLGGAVMADKSHLEGGYNRVEQYSSCAHVEGMTNYAASSAAHVEGSQNAAQGHSAHTEGCSNIAYSDYSHAEGFYTRALGNSAHTEGKDTLAYDYGHAEGLATQAVGYEAHSEGNGTKAIGNSAHAEGDFTISAGQAAHTEGYRTIADEPYSHAEGKETKALATYSHAEGNATYISKEGYGSHVEGDHTESYSPNQHVEGKYNDCALTEARNSCSFFGIGGNGTQTYTLDAPSYRIDQIVSIEYRRKVSFSYEPYTYTGTVTNTNKSITFNPALPEDVAITVTFDGIGDKSRSPYAHIVGNGSYSKRSNAHTLDWNGNAEYAGDVVAGGCGGSNPVSLMSLAGQMPGISFRIVNGDVVVSYEEE